MKWHCGRFLISGAGYSSVLPPAPVHLTNQAVAQDFLQTLRQIMPRMSKKTRKEKFMPVFILLVKFCCWTKIVPYCWDEEEKILKTCSSRSFHWFLVVPGGVSLIKTAYLGARFLSLYFWPTEAMTANEKILSSVLFIHWSLFGLHAVFLAALINLAMHADGVKIVCNFLLRTREESTFSFGHISKMIMTVLKEIFKLQENICGRTWPWLKSALQYIASGCSKWQLLLYPRRAQAICIGWYRQYCRIEWHLPFMLYLVPTNAFSVGFPYFPSSSSLCIWPQLNTF